MAKIVVLFNLKDGTDVTEYESWALSTDLPTVKNLQSIDSFDLLKSVSVLGSEAPSPYQYIEILDINDFDTFGKEVASDTMTKIAAQFQSFADSPLFLVTEDVT